MHMHLLSPSDYHSKILCLFLPLLCCSYLLTQLWVRC
jgi:hypothetical protein